MKLKICTCGKQLTTKNVHNHGRTDHKTRMDMLWFSCLECRSTLVLRPKNRMDLPMAEYQSSVVTPINYAEIELLALASLSEEEVDLMFEQESKRKV